MKTCLIIFLLLTAPRATWSPDIYKSENVVFEFFSEAPIEDISAKSDQGVSAIDVKSRAIYFKVGIRSFEFRKKLMQQHFNEKYLESDKYPNAEFKGSIIEPVDLSKDGTYPVTVKGNLNIHNVTKSYTVKGKITVSNGTIAASSVFRVRLADHDIKIPRLVIRNIAEVVQVQVSGNYQPTATP